MRPAVSLYQCGQDGAISAPELGNVMHWMGMGRPPPDELEEYVKEVRRPSYQRGAGRIDGVTRRESRGLCFFAVLFVSSVDAMQNCEGSLSRNKFLF